MSTNHHSSSDYATDPVVIALLKGNTICVNIESSLGSKEHPYRNLYAFMASRGLRLRMYLYDDFDLEVYRGALMWCEPFSQLWICSKCGEGVYSSVDIKPTNIGCAEDKHSKHAWNPWRASKATSVVKKAA